MAKELAECTCRRCKEKFNIDIRKHKRDAAIQAAERLSVLCDLCDTCAQMERYREENDYAMANHFPDIEAQSETQLYLAVHLRHQYIITHRKKINTVKSILAQNNTDNSDEINLTDEEINLFENYGLIKELACLTLNKASLLIETLNASSSFIYRHFNK